MKLSPFLYAMVIIRLINGIRKESSLTMIFADNIAIGRRVEKMGEAKLES